MSNGEEFRGPWNEGKSPELGESWEYIADPLEHVKKTNGMSDGEVTGTSRTIKESEKMSKELSEKRSAEIKKAWGKNPSQWSNY